MNLGRYSHTYLKTTETCNLNCSHCFTSGSNGAKIYFKPDETMSFYKNLIEAQPQIQHFHMVLHGGEPMLFPVKELDAFCDSWKELMKDSNKSCSIGIQTNLVYSMAHDKRAFFKKHIDNFGTSWDYMMRFEEWKSDVKLHRWYGNVEKLIHEDGHNMTLMVCMTHDLIRNKEPKDIIGLAVALGFKYILFERVTGDGNAVQNPEMFPNNHELDAWMHLMWKQTLEFGYHEKIKNMLLNEIARAYVYRQHVANRCRNCEKTLMTINADGSIAGCPNTAPKGSWGHINWPISKSLESKARKKVIVCEAMPDPRCLSCPAYNICNGDCHQLEWQGDKCAAPQAIFQEMLKKDDVTTYEKLIF